MRGIADVGFCGSDVFNEGYLAGKYTSLRFKAISGAGCDLVLAGKPSLNLRQSLKIATSYPLQTIRYCQQRGYQIDLEALTEFGGGIEGKLISDKFNAIVDLRSSGETLRQNGLTVFDCFDTIQTGIVYKKEAADVLSGVVDIWRLYAEAQTLQNRYQQAQSATELPQRKSTVQLLMDGNKRRKNLGEETAELVAADATGVDIATEVADVGFAIKVIAVANGLSAVRALNEELMRNAIPDLPELPRK